MDLNFDPPPIKVPAIQCVNSPPGGERHKRYEELPGAEKAFQRFCVIEHAPYVDQILDRYMAVFQLKVFDWETESLTQQRQLEKNPAIRK